MPTIFGFDVSCQSFQTGFTVILVLPICTLLPFLRAMTKVPLVVSSAVSALVVFIKLKPQLART